MKRDSFFRFLPSLPFLAPVVMRAKNVEEKLFELEWPGETAEIHTKDGLVKELFATHFNPYWPLSIKAWETKNIDDIIAALRHVGWRVTPK